MPDMAIKYLQMERIGIMQNFCGKCGTELIDGVCPKCVQSQTTTVNKRDEKFKNFFMSPNEKLVAVLGNSYLENFFHSGTVGKGFAVASDKRVYFQGKKFYLGEDGEIEVSYNSRVVDLRDVTGTGFDSFADNGWLYLGVVISVISVIFSRLVFLDSKGMFFSLVIFIALALLSLFAAYSFYKYYKSRHSLIVIQYAGGEIGYELKWFGNQEIELFQKQLRLAKDKSIEREGASRFIENSNKTSSSVADELSKLADLLQKGIITQEEFEKVKEELI